MSGPEAIHAAMTSGDPGQLGEVSADLRKAMADLSDSIELIGFAEDRPDWDSPSARTRFNMSAWASKASAEVAFIRVNRAALAVTKVRADYQSMQSAADQALQRWRTFKAAATDPVSVLLARYQTMLLLHGISTTFGSEIDAAIAFLVSDPLSSDQQAWLESGLARSMRHDLETPGEQGPIIPNTLATGDDRGWTPQGLGYDPDSQLLLQTAYSGADSQLSLVDPETGEQVNLVNLGSAPGEDGSASAPDHAGGVAVRDGSVYVMSSDQPPRMFTYSMHDVRDAAPGDTVPVRGQPQEMPAGAYSTITGDTLYVGSFTEGEDDPGQLWTYRWDQRAGEWAKASGPHPTPPQTQGVTVSGDEVVFSTSWGRDNTGALKRYPLAEVTGQDGGSLGEPLGTVSTPNMAEGVAALPDGIVSTYEAGSLAYSGGADLEDLWATMDMTVTPMSELGGTGGGTIDVVPMTLHQASSSFDQAEAGLRAGAGAVGSVSVPAGSMGSVAQGASFASAVTTHCDETSDWIAQGRIAAGVTASGLVSTASDYDESDSGIGGLIDRLNPFGG